MTSWIYPCRIVPKTRGTRFRVLVAVCPLQALPGGKPVEMRLYLKQWDGQATEPHSWCVDEMKFAADSPEQSMDPFQPLQHVQVSERDWDAYYGRWGQAGRDFVTLLRSLKAAAPALQVSITDD